MKTQTWNGHKIRFVEKDGEWWAVLKDVCDALNLRTDGVKVRLDANHISNGVERDESGRLHKLLIVDEFSIYDTVFHSRKKEAKDFRLWVYAMLKELRAASGLAGFEVFRMLDKEHQKEMMRQLRDNLKQPVRVDFIKANTIANKAVSMKHGHDKMVKKGEMTPPMLADRQSMLESAVELMTVNERYNLGLSVSKCVYRQIAALENATDQTA